MGAIQRLRRGLLRGGCGVSGPMFGSSNERFVRNLGYIRSRDPESTHTVIPGSLSGPGQRARRKDAGPERRGAQGHDRRSSANGWPRARPSTTCCPKRSPPAARPACRTKNMRHFDVQILGGIVLHRGNIAEMVTGEGKTLVATLPAYLNALSGKGVHIITVNDYLARRDCEWMLPIYQRPGHHRRLHPERHGPRRTPQGLRLRHHLRHQQRVRLRLPARQHEAGPLGRRRITSPTISSARRPSTSPSSTRWTTSSSTRPARRSSSPAPPSAT